MLKKDIERFWSKTKRVGACLEWIGSLDGRGYGKFVTFAEGKHKYHIASRIAWELTNGETNKQVCHKCDNTKCVAPSHLFIGSKSDNMRDMVSKGRNQYRAGENNPRAKLTLIQVEEIRSLRRNKMSPKILAKRFGISVKTVYNLCDLNQKCWTGRRSMKGFADR